jgi:hypothetical protein
MLLVLKKFSSAASASLIGLPDRISFWERQTTPM